MKNFKFGFTLIELLIVIALLGALAVGLLAALDPFEQLKKGTDTGVRNTVSEFHGAVLRYYAIKSYMPWCTTAACTTRLDGVAADPSNVAISAMPLTIAEIAASGELKTDFSSLAGATTLGKIVIFGSSTNATLKVCYKPLAKSFISDPNTKYVVATGLEAAAGTCKGQGGADLTCLWCVN